MGPVVALAERLDNNDMKDILEIVYAPIIWLVTNTEGPFRDFMIWYAERWGWY